MYFITLFHHPITLSSLQPSFYLHNSLFPYILLSKTVTIIEVWWYLNQDWVQCSSNHNIFCFLLRLSSLFTVCLHYVIFVFFLFLYLFAEIPVFEGIFGIVICWRQLSLPSLQCYVYQLSSSYKYPYYLIQKRDKVEKRCLQLSCINLSSFLGPNVTLVETHFQFTT